MASADLMAFTQSSISSQEKSLQLRTEFFIKSVFQVLKKSGTNDWQSTGTCFLYCPQWYALTCHHVVKDSDAEYAIVIKDSSGSTSLFPVFIVNFSEPLDLAVLRVGDDHFAHSLHERPHVLCCPYNSSEKGSKTYCAGFPENHNQIQVTEGFMTLSDNPMFSVVTNITDHGTSGGPCTATFVKQFVGVIVSDFGIMHHRTQLIPHSVVHSFIRSLGPSVPDFPFFTVNDQFKNI